MFLKISFCFLGGIVLLFVGTLLIGGLPSLLFDARFLPSQDWVARSSGAANRAGLFLGAYAFLVMLACPLKDPSVLEQVHFKKRPWLKLMLVSFFAGGLLWGSSYMIVVQGVPMVQAAVAGTEVRLAYTVEGALQTRGWKCPRAIRLADMPPLLNRVCNVPNSLRNILKRGDTVYVVGRGTSNGVFYGRFTLYRTEGARSDAGGAEISQRPEAR